MSKKTLIWIGILIGSSLGSWISSLLGQDVFSGWGIVLSSIGGVVGIWLGYTFGEE